MHILDIQDDPQRHMLQAISTQVEVPEFVKQASLEDKHVWAWPEAQKFALDTPADIWLSKQYFDKTASHLEPVVRREVDKRISQAITFSGVPIASSEKQASVAELTNEQFALRLKTAGMAPAFTAKYMNFVRNGELVMYPVATEAQVKQANTFFPRGLNNELAPMRPFVAQKIASLLPEDELSGEVLQYLPMSHKEACYQLDIRSGASKEFSEKYQSAKAFLSPSMDRLKMASLIHALDDQSGITASLGNRVKSASMFLRGVKEAEKEPVRVKVKTASVWDTLFEDGSFDTWVPGLSKAASKQELIDQQPESVKNVIFMQIMKGAN